MLDPALTRLVSKRLRTHEHVQAILVGRVPARGSTFVASTASTTVDDQRRVLAVVTNDDSGRQEGGVFLFKRAESGDLETAVVIAIAQDFELKFGQKSSPAESVDSEAASPLEKSDIVVTIEGGGQAASLEISDSPGLQDFLTLVRELKGLSLADAAMQTLSAQSSHHWLRWYNPSILGGSKVHFTASNYYQYLRTPHPMPSLSLATPGYPGDEATDAILIQEAYIRSRMRQRMPEYSSAHPISVHIATFNVNGKPPSERLWSLVGMDPEAKKTKPTADVFVFGFQELDLSTEALLYLSTTEKEDSWCDAIFEDMGDEGKKYMKLTSKRLVGMLIFVIVRKALRPHIHHISTTASGQGVMWMGNKGGVALRFRVYDTVFTFVNSHLAAFDEMVERRNADYSELRRLIKFPDPLPVPTGEVEFSASGVQHSGILESDYTFWLALATDQNYRIDLPVTDVHELIPVAAEMGDYDALLAFDQLKEQRRLGRCFTEFTEGKITFAPTYKYDVGKSTYDPKRRPAFTDRILYYTADTSTIKQLDYTSHPEVTLSDHKPVTSTFEVETWHLNLERMLEVLEEITVPLEDLPDTDSTPELSLEPSHTDFGIVSCGVPLERTITLTNTGAAVCIFRFVQPVPEEDIAPHWLKVSPTSSVILPGKSLSIKLTLLVNPEDAGPLNTGHGSLKDVLVIHVARGKDYFASLSGQFNRTCLGNSLSWLASLPGPIRNADVKAARPRSGGGAPQEIMRLVSWLMSNATQEERLFLDPGDEYVTAEIIECLDTGAEFPSTGSRLALSIGAVLLKLMDSFTEPVIPRNFYNLCAYSSDRDQAFSVVEQLPPVATNLLISLTAFLHFFLTDTDGTRARALAHIFGPIILKDDPSSSPSSWLSPVAKSRFILQLIA